MPSNFDPTNVMKSLDTLFDQDVQERRLRTIRRDVITILDDVRVLDDEVEPKRIVAVAGEATYQSQVTALRTALIACLTALDAIDAIA